MSRGRERPVEEGEVSALTHDGRGIVAADGKKAFVVGVLPGERIRYQRSKRRRGYDEARLVDIVDEAAERIEPRCAVFGVCGGCVLQHLPPPLALEHKARVLKDNLERIGGIPEPPLLEPMSGPVWNYRRRARLGVKFVHAKDRVLVGFRERAKPYITDMQACPVLDAAAETLPASLAELIGRLSIRAELPQVELAVGDNDRALVFRVLRTPSRSDLEAFRTYEKQSGFQVLLQPGGLDSVVSLAGFAAHSRGPGRPLHYRLRDFDLTLEFAATDFIQINREINEALIARALEWLAPRPDDAVLDLFSGIGNFSLPLARLAGRVLGVEGAGVLSERARQNAERNGIDNVEFVTADLERLSGDEPWLEDSWDLVLLDPARAGASAMVEDVARMRPRRIVYVSCHPGTLARDVGAFVGQHGFRFVRGGVVDMFPHTAHVESIVLLEDASIAN